MFNGAGKKCLIVESDLIWQGILRRAIEGIKRFTFEFTMAPEYTSALNSLLSDRFDLMLLDLSLSPDVEKKQKWGRHLLVTLKTEDHAIPPTVVVSGKTEFDDILDLLNNFRAHIFHVAPKRTFQDVGRRQEFIAGVLNALEAQTVVSQTALTLPQSTERLVHHLERFEHALRRWRWDDTPKTKGRKSVRWIVGNEYHVQDILWLILAPLFPDLEDEENLPSLGQKKPRCDLGIPSLSAIVEVKYVRSKADFSKVIGEVASDASLYLAKQDRYDKIIVFIYDDSQNNQEHEVCRRGLLEIRGIEGVVIVSRPSKIASRMQK